MSADSSQTGTQPRNMRRNSHHFRMTTSLVDFSCLNKLKKQTHYFHK